MGGKSTHLICTPTLFHTLITDAWQAAVHFGLSAGKNVYRDAMRFWRVLMLDIFPPTDGSDGGHAGISLMVEFFTDVFDWVDIAFRYAQTGLSAQ